MEFEFTPVDDVNKVPEQFRPLYAQGEDGKFNINPEYKGVVEAVTGLNRSLKAARAEAKSKTTVDLSSLAEFGDSPDKIKETVSTKLKELQDQLALGDKAKLNLDKVREDLNRGHAAEQAKLTARNEALQNQLYGMMVENAATAAVVDAKGVPDLLLPFIKNQVKVLEKDGQFQVFVVDSQGDQRFSGVTGQPMTIKELVAEMKANEKYGRLFESETPAGGGTQPGGAARPGGMRPSMAPKSSTEKIASGLARGGARRGR